MATNSKIGLKEAVAIGIGGMVGGGIFAVLGLSVSLAGGGVPVSFLIAGVIAFLAAYSYSKLSKKFPDAGGTVRFIDEGLGFGVFSGGLNNMLWVSYIIMLSLYSSAFGSYASSIIHITGDGTLDRHILISAILIISTFINYYSIKIVGEFTRKLWGKPIGLALIAVLTLIITNTIDLESISTSGSAGFLLIFGRVNFVAFKLSGQIGVNKYISFAAFVFCILAFIVLVVQQFQHNMVGILLALGIFTVCFVGEWIYKLSVKKPMDK